METLEIKIIVRTSKAMPHCLGSPLVLANNDQCYHQHQLVQTVRVRGKQK